MSRMGIMGSLRGSFLSRDVVIDTPFRTSYSLDASSKRKLQERLRDSCWDCTAEPWLTEVTRGYRNDPFRASVAVEENTPTFAVKLRNEVVTTRQTSSRMREEPLV